MDEGELYVDVDRVMSMFLAITRGVQSREQTELHGLDLSMPQVLTLETLRNRASYTMGEVAGSMSVGFSTMTKIVDRLVQRGLIERCSDPDDRRIVRILLTERGHELAKELWETRKKVMSSVLRLLGQEDQKAFFQIIKALHSVITKTAEENLDHHMDAGSSST